MKKKVLLISLLLTVAVSVHAQTGTEPDRSLYPGYQTAQHNDTTKVVPVRDNSHSEQDSNEEAYGRDLPSTEPQRYLTAFRMNLLLPLFNAGIEMPIGRHFSFATDIYYPWFGFDKSNANCLQAAMVDAQFRWWLNPRKIEGVTGNTMTGSVISLGAYAGLYDFERDYRGLQGEITGLYLDYGYTFYLSSYCRLTLSVGAGITGLPYRSYTVYNNGGKLIRDHARFDYLIKWIGPMHAGITLTIPVMGEAKKKKA